MYPYINQKKQILYLTLSAEPYLFFVSASRQLLHTEILTQRGDSQRYLPSLEGRQTCKGNFIYYSQANTLLSALTASFSSYRLIFVQFLPPYLGPTALFSSRKWGKAKQEVNEPKRYLSKVNHSKVHHRPNTAFFISLTIAKPRVTQPKAQKH